MRQSSEFYGPSLLHQRQVVLQVPVIGDLSVLHAIDVNGTEADLAAIAFEIFEAAGEMPGKDVSDNSAVVHDQQLPNFRS
jgi:hypothetical protein